MTKLTTGFICILLIALLVPVNSYAASEDSATTNWTNWRGSDYSGAAKTGNPPAKWSETENIKWKVSMPGESLSTPIIWENKIIFLTSIPVTASTASANSNLVVTPAAFGRGNRGGGNRGGGSSGFGGGGGSRQSEYKFDVVCMDKNDGKIIWQKTAIQTTPHEGKHNTGSYASNSATTDGKNIWAGFGSRGVYCYDMDGNEIWKKDLGKMRILASFGEGSSVALAGKALIVVMDQEDQSVIYALNKDTGDILWQKDRNEGTSWATPLPVEVDGKLQVVTSATKQVRCYDVETGDVVWYCTGQTSNVIPSPVKYGNMVIITSGFSGNKIQAIELGHTGNLDGTDAIKWQTSNRTTPYVPSPLLYGDKFYVLFNNNNVLSCYNAQTGKPYYESKQLQGAGGYYSAPTGAGDKVYLASQNGVTIVIKNSDTFEVLASNKLDDKFDASPVVSGDELFLKGQKFIYCIAEK